MIKQEVINKVARKTGYEVVEVSAIFHEVLNQIKENIDEGIYIRGFGSFIMKTRKAKPARDISRGTEVMVPEHQVPFFKPSKEYFTQKF